MPTVPCARVLRDSVSVKGDRLTTFEATMHRFVLAELNTHRAFSRNSASSRAIPVAKQIERVMFDPAVPIEFGSNRAGMQAGEPLQGDDYLASEASWLCARDYAVTEASRLAALGVHKQITNRLLEPFMWHTVLITATDFDNFFDQRCSPLAQPEIRAVADEMKYAYQESVPETVVDGHWHLPLIQPDEQFIPYEAKAISVARCARVSYLTHAGVRDPQADLELFERLVSADPKHYSPMEHVATPCTHNRHTVSLAYPGGSTKPMVVPKLGNLTGWLQYRHVLAA